LAEYRLDELARISGVSARNIRAYRERGLLDPPRRVGRSAFYDDYHLSQLRTINQLLRRGFNSAHIAEFFASMRQGADLADILGIQRAVLGPRTGQAAEEVPSTAAPSGAAMRVLGVDPNSDEARKLIEYGLAERVDASLVMTDPAIGEIVARATDQMLYVRAVLRIYEATGDAIDDLAGGFVHTLEESVAARFSHVPEQQETDELSRIVQDYRDLWSRVVSDRLDKALQQQMTSAASGYTAAGGRVCRSVVAIYTRVVAGSPPKRWASHTGMIATIVSAAATTLMTGAWLGRNRFPKIQIGSVCTVGPAVNVVTTISSKDSANANIAPASRAPRIIGNVT
jgi:DNA-binding transcriptional MerR regulator